MTKRVLVLVLGLSLIACGEESSEKPAGEGSTDPSQAAPPALIDQPVELKQKSAGREFSFKGTAGVPEGWKKHEQRGGNLRFYPEGSSGMMAPFLAVTLDCGGQCSEDKLLGNIAGMAKSAIKFLPNKKIVREEKVKDGTWLYELGEGEKKNVKVMHWQKGWPRIVSCEFAVNGKTANLFDPLLKACTDMTVAVTDPYYPADVLSKEEANLAKCPKANTLTYKPSKEGETAYDFTQTKAYAHRGSLAPGLALYFPNFATTQKRFRKENTLKDGQAVVALRFSEKVEKGQSQKPTFSGTYGVKHDASKKVSISLKTANGKSLGWSSRTVEGSVTIVARTKTKLCGTVDISGGNRGDVKGTFNVDIL